MKNRYYFVIQLKRMLCSLRGIVLGVAAALILAGFTVLLSSQMMPEAFHIAPFTVGICLEGEDIFSNYLYEYIRQMESTRSMVVYTIMSETQAREKMEQGELCVYLVIPEGTARSIMDGSNIPVRVYLKEQDSNPQSYIQQKLITSLTDSAVRLIDVPQSETLKLVEVSDGQFDDSTEIKIDIQHFNMVSNRRNCFDCSGQDMADISDLSGYYASAAMTLMLLLWGIGSGPYFCGENEMFTALVNTKGISRRKMAMIRNICAFIAYLPLIPALWIISRITVGDAPSIGLLFAGAILSESICALVFGSSGKNMAGVGVLLILQLILFFAAGGIVPDIFLPQICRELSTWTPQGILFQSVLFPEKSGTGIIGLLIWAALFQVISTEKFVHGRWT